MAKHKKRRTTYRKDATTLDILIYEIESGWLGTVLLVAGLVMIFLCGAVIGRGL